jgi:hypothetical protein
MNWTNQPATENQPGGVNRPGEESSMPLLPPGLGQPEAKLSGPSALANTPEPVHKIASLPAVAATASSPHPDSQVARFRVELDKRGQVHIHCLQGKETVASIGLTSSGLNSLVQQGLMRKPRSFAIGALHDWVELEGELCSFEKGRNDSAHLEQLLNERYVPASTAGSGKLVAVYINAASPTGFEIQFPLTLAGSTENRRRPMNDQALELLQDSEHCGLLHKRIIVKLIPPNLVFKERTPDGGERYLLRSIENTLPLAEEEGRQKTIDLSQPINYMRLTPLELTSLFNHPSINRFTNAAPQPGPPVEPPQHPRSQTAAITAPQTPAPSVPVSAATPTSGQPHTQPAAAPSLPPPAQAQAALQPAEPPKPSPNLWVKSLLSRHQLEHDWFASLVYAAMAQRFGNSAEGTLGSGACWYINLGETEAVEDPAFKGVFLTEKRSLGFLSQGQMARFGHGVAFVGSQAAAIEGIEIGLIAVGLDARQRVVFVVRDGYRNRFDVPEATLGEALACLGAQGAVIMSVSEILTSHEPLEVVWTVPAEQSDPNDPQVLESSPPPSSDIAPQLPG